MIITDQTGLAKRYAVAFSNVFAEKITPEFVEAAQQLRLFMRKHAGMFVFFKLSHIDDDHKKKQLQTLLRTFRVDELCMPLAQLLLKDKRMQLFPEVINQLIAEYKRRHAIQNFSFCVSHQLSDEDLGRIKNFLARQTGCVIMYDYRIDRSLIAGIRLQSDTLLWEYSIRKQLKRVELQSLR